MENSNFNILEPEWPDLGVALETSSGARGITGGDADRIGIEHPLGVTFDVFDVCPNLGRWTSDSYCYVNRLFVVHDLFNSGFGKRLGLRRGSLDSKRSCEPS